MPLSTKQMEYLALAWQCFETEPKIDYDKFKTVAGLASANSARELLRVTKKKLKMEYGEPAHSPRSSKQVGAGTDTPTKTTPRSSTASGGGGKRKKRSEAKIEMSEEEEAEEGEDSAVPSKRARKSLSSSTVRSTANPTFRSRSVVKVKREAGADEVEEERVPGRSTIHGGGEEDDDEGDEIV